MAIDQAVKIRNYNQFEQIGREVTEMVDMDPAKVFENLVPGFLGNLFQSIGAWPARDQKHFEFPSKNGEAHAVSPMQRARQGGYDKKRIIALSGLAIAGETQTVLPNDFAYGGMTPLEVTRRTTRPRADFNKTVFRRVLMQVATQGFFLGAAFTENFTFSVLDEAGNTVTKQIVSQSATTVADVVANSTQTITWPLRDGTESTAGRDHVVSSAGAWTIDLHRTHRELLTNILGQGDIVDVYCGKTVAEAVRAYMATLGTWGPAEREYKEMSIPSKGGLGAAFLVTDRLEETRVFYCPDLPATVAIYHVSGQKPFYLSVGADGVDGSTLETGFWTNDLARTTGEIRGMEYGYREYVNAGCQKPVGVVLVQYA